MTQDTTPTERALTVDGLRNAVKMLYWPQPHANDYAAGFDDCRAAVLRLLDGDAEWAARAEPGLRDWEFNWIKVQVAVERRTNRQGVVDWPSVAAELTLMVRAALEAHGEPQEGKR